MTDCVEKTSFRIETEYRTGWNKLENFAPRKPGGAYTLLQWQDEARIKLEHAHWWLVDAPPGAGKSCLICCLAAISLNLNPKLRAIIAVPQNLIGSSFGPKRLNVPGVGVVAWGTNHDLCGKGTNKADALLNFLQKPRRNMLEDRVLVCTHSTLVAAFKACREAFKDVTLVVDEAHHVAYGETAEEREVVNGVGTVIQWAMSRPDIQIGLTTATFWRGDRFPIIPKKHLDRFKRYNLSHPDYLACCKHLRSIGYDFILYRRTYYEALCGLLDRYHTSKLIIYIPPVGSHCSLGSKEIDVTAVIKAIAGTEKPVVRDRSRAVMRVMRGDVELRVINLVDEDLRDEKKKAIEEAHSHVNSQTLDVVIALNMFREGGNWMWADREIIIGPRNSLTDMVQTVGRVLRDAKGKPHAQIHHVLPTGPLTSDDRTKQNLNDYVTSLFASMIMGDMFNPVRLSTPVISVPEGVALTPERTSPALRLFSDAYEALSFCHSVWCEMRLDDRNALGTDARPELEKAVTEVMRQLGKTEFRDEIVAYLWKLLTTQTLQASRLNVTDIGFKMLHDHPFGFMLGYTSGVFGIDRWRQLKEALVSRESWTKEKVIASAKPFKNISRWAGAHPCAYNAALANNWHEEATAHMTRMLQSWTKEKVIASAKPFKTKKEWRKHCSSAFDAARHNEWYFEATAHMRNVVHYWTKEEVVASAKRHSVLSRWIDVDFGAYRAARRHKWLIEATAHMTRLRGQWTKEKVIASAKPFKIRRCWAARNGSAYQAARREGWLEEATAHMRKRKEQWTKERVIASAKLFKSLSTWEQSYPGARNASRRHGWTEEATAHMTRMLQSWTKEKVIASAKPFKTKKPWIKRYSGACQAARREGWLEEATAHMDKTERWTKERVVVRAKHFKSMSPWIKKYPGAYEAAKKAGWLAEATAHMEKRKNNAQLR